MKFGRVPSLDGIDFSLPESSLCRFAAPEDSSRANRVWVGAPVWTHAGFVGKIYPPKLKPTEVLAYYGRNFNCIELNSTFYGIPKPSTITTWQSVVPEDFRFCPKAPRAITHDSLAIPKRMIRDFFRALEGFAGKLGPCFFQLSPEVGPHQWRWLKALLREFPSEFRVAVELRHRAWFDTDKAQSWLEDTFAEAGCSLVISDTAGRRDVLHQVFPTPTTLVRFCGNSLVPSDFGRLDAWSDRLRLLMDHGMDDIYFFIHQPEEGDCVELAEHLHQRFPSLPPVQRVRSASQLALF